MSPRVHCKPFGQPDLHVYQRWGPDGRPILNPGRCQCGEQRVAGQWRWYLPALLAALFLLAR
jgi:hypothetical protein